MKSSTIRRSTLSKETMEVIENLAKEQEETGILGEYVRPEDIEYHDDSDNKNGMSQEIDLLWQNFKTTQFNTKSPMGYILIGVIIGVVSTFIILFGINSISTNTSGTEGGNFGIGKIFVKKQEQTKETTLEEQASINQGVNDNIPADINSEQEQETAQNEEFLQDSVDTSKMTKYVVKSGDTVESIIKQHYGSYSQEKADMIMKANNMANLDRISIDQELYLP